MRRIDEAGDRPIAAIEGECAGIEQHQDFEALAGEEGEIFGRAVGGVGFVGGQVGDLAEQRGAGGVIGDVTGDGGLAGRGLYGREGKGIGDRRVELCDSERQALRRAFGDHRCRLAEVGDGRGAAADAETIALELEAALAQMRQGAEAEIERGGETVRRTAAELEICDVGTRSAASLSRVSLSGTKPVKDSAVPDFSMARAKSAMRGGSSVTVPPSLLIAAVTWSAMAELAGAPGERDGAIADRHFSAFEQQQSFQRFQCIGLEC